MHVLADALTDFKNFYQLLSGFGFPGAAVAFAVMMIKGWIITKREYDAARTGWREKEAMHVAQIESLGRLSADFKAVAEKAMEGAEGMRAMVQEMDHRIDLIEIHTPPPKGRERRT